ncbi:MAG: hypothetical protein U0800_08220 [Isosphaeraceae bacterium]
MELDPGVVFLTGYECPGCGADLELPAKRADSWLRCPRCGRPSEPPDQAQAAGPWAHSRAPFEIPATEAGQVVPGPQSPGMAGGAAFKALAPILFGIALGADLVLRFVVGVDPMVQMVADIAAFLMFSLCAFMVLRAMIRP